jgi:hypothetical protein
MVQARLSVELDVRRLERGAGAPELVVTRLVFKALSAQTRIASPKDPRERRLVEGMLADAYGKWQKHPQKYPLFDRLYEPDGRTLATATTCRPSNPSDGRSAATASTTIPPSTSSMPRLSRARRACQS